jgi:hypothetical protein
MGFKLTISCTDFVTATFADIRSLLSPLLPDLNDSRIYKGRGKKFSVLNLETHEEAKRLLDARFTLKFRGYPVYVRWFKERPWVTKKVVALIQ